MQQALQGEVCACDAWDCAVLPSLAACAVEGRDPLPLPAPPLPPLLSSLMSAVGAAPGDAWVVSGSPAVVLDVLLAALLLALLACICGVEALLLLGVRSCECCPFILAESSAFSCMAACNM
jgi:hypothetical protein